MLLPLSEESELVSLPLDCGKALPMAPSMNRIASTQTHLRFQIGGFAFLDFPAESSSIVKRPLSLKPIIAGGGGKSQIDYCE